MTGGVFAGKLWPTRRARTERAKQAGLVACHQKPRTGREDREPFERGVSYAPGAAGTALPAVYGNRQQAALILFFLASGLKQRRTGD
jgi:hypothetical protein